MRGFRDLFRRLCPAFSSCHLSQSIVFIILKVLLCMHTGLAQMVLPGRGVPSYMQGMNGTIYVEGRVS